MYVGRCLEVRSGADQKAVVCIYLTSNDAPDANLGDEVAAPNRRVESGRIGSMLEYVFFSSSLDGTWAAIYMGWSLTFVLSCRLRLRCRAILYEMRGETLYTLDWYARYFAIDCTYRCTRARLHHASWECHGHFPTGEHIFERPWS